MNQAIGLILGAVITIQIVVLIALAMKVYELEEKVKYMGLSEDLKRESLVERGELRRRIDRIEEKHSKRLEVLEDTTLPPESPKMSGPPNSNEAERPQSDTPRS